MKKQVKYTLITYLGAFLLCYQAVALDLDLSNVEVRYDKSLYPRDCQKYAEAIVSLCTLLQDAREENRPTFLEQIKDLNNILKDCEKANNKKRSKVGVTVGVSSKS